MTGTRAVANPSNAEALAAWDGDDGAYWAAHEVRFDDALARYHRRFLDAAAITSGEQVLDVGCGTGQSTRDAARLATPGLALGVDLSSRMIGRARQRAAEQDITNARFVQADAHVYPFEPRAFDVAISRTGAMFFGDPVAAFANIARALRPGGRVAGWPCWSGSRSRRTRGRLSSPSPWPPDERYRRSPTIRRGRSPWPIPTGFVRSSPAQGSPRSPSRVYAN
jgi:SAM-dependent methyltransferase